MMWSLRASHVSCLLYLISSLDAALECSLLSLYNEIGDDFNNNPICSMCNESGGRTQQWLKDCSTVA